MILTVAGTDATRPLAEIFLRDRFASNRPTQDIMEFARGLRHYRLPRGHSRPLKRRRRPNLRESNLQETSRRRLIPVFRQEK